MRSLENDLCDKRDRNRKTGLRKFFVLLRKINDKTKFLSLKERINKIR